ncbi:hypothetical protein DEU38_13439 [Rhodococcus sp. AG1013]|nr:hypothetical protein DEU38_13439 [Rhodococcus sp. AG1013]
MTETFTAWTSCPHCNAVDCHRLRAPRGFSDGDPAHARQKRFAEMSGYTFRPAPKRLIRCEEQGFEVIRMCTVCGHEWGQM